MAANMIDIDLCKELLIGRDWNFIKSFIIIKFLLVKRFRFSNEFKC